MRVSRKKTAVSNPSLAFWNCQLTVLEWLLFAAAFGISVALHLTPVLDSGIARYLIILLAAICFCSPFTGFFFIGCCSVLPFDDPMARENILASGFGANTAANLGPSPAKIGILVWLVVTIIRYQRYSLKGVSNLWPVLPWLVLIMIITQEFVFTPNSEYMKALMYSLMACQLANEAKGEYLKALMGLSLGALIMMVAYWGVTVGLPIEISTYGAARGGIERIGSVRADSVMVWPAILMGLSGILGLSLVLGSRLNPIRTSRWFFILAGGLFVAAIPPMVGTMTHGAYAGMGMLVVGAIAGILYMIKSGKLTGKQTALIGIGTAIVAGIVLWIFATNALDLKTRSVGLFENYESQSADMGMAASRTGVWYDSINTIMEHPLVGIKGSGAKETITTEYAKAGYYLSHNVFLDYGRAIGIPGMLLVMLFFFYPAIKVFQCRNPGRFIPFVMMHFAMFIFWVSLSFQFYKTFWGFWMLMVMAVSAQPHSMRRSISHRRRHHSQAQHTEVDGIASIVDEPGHRSSPVRAMPGLY